MFLSSLRDKFTLGHHVGAPGDMDGHQHVVSLQITINLAKKDLRKSWLRKIDVT